MAWDCGVDVVHGHADVGYFDSQQGVSMTSTQAPHRAHTEEGIAARRRSVSERTARRWQSGRRVLAASCVLLAACAMGLQHSVFGSTAFVNDQREALMAQQLSFGVMSFVALPALMDSLLMSQRERLECSISLFLLQTYRFYIAYRSRSAQHSAHSKLAS